MILQPITTVMQASGGITLVNTLADRLKAERERVGLSQTELASKAGVVQSTIANAEAGIRKKPRELVSIAEALGLIPKWLESGRGPKHHPARGDESSVHSIHAIDQPLPLTEALPVVLRLIEQANEVTRPAIVAALHRLLDDPSQLARTLPLLELLSKGVPVETRDVASAKSTGP